MDLKRHLNPKSVFIGLYVFAFLIYIIVGLSPVDASNYDGSITIPSIDLDSEVTKLSLVDHELKTPDYIVGSFSRNEQKELLIGHSTTVFSDLKDIKLYDQIYYNNSTFEVRMIDMIPKSSVSMYDLLASTEKRSIVLMTCAGQMLDNGDSSHRLIVYAVKTD